MRDWANTPVDLWRPMGINASSPLLNPNTSLAAIGQQAHVMAMGRPQRRRRKDFVGRQAPLDFIPMGNPATDVFAAGSQHYGGLHDPHGVRNRGGRKGPSGSLRQAPLDFIYGDPPGVQGTGPRTKPAGKPKAETLKQRVTGWKNEAAAKWKGDWGPKANQFAKTHGPKYGGILGIAAIIGAFWAMSRSRNDTNQNVQMPHWGAGHAGYLGMIHNRSFGTQSKIVNTKAKTSHLFPLNYDMIGSQPHVNATARRSYSGHRHA